MRSTLAQAIRRARRACGLTQEQLGRRLGLKGRAIYRWERDDSAPSKRHKKALVTAINAVNQDAAAALAAVLASDGKATTAVAAVPPAPALPAISDRVALELAVFAMADELDLSPRWIRGSLRRLLKRLRDAKLTLEAAERELEEWSLAGVRPIESLPDR